MTEKKGTENTVITIVHPDHNFEEGFERQLLEYNAEDWDRAYVWPTNWVKRGIHLLHNEFGNIGISKTVSCSVLFGFSRYYENNTELLDMANEKYNELLKTESIVSDHIMSSRVDASHMRDTVGDREWEFRLPPQRKGLMRDTGKILNMNMSQMYRHVLGITLYEASRHYDWEIKAPKEYEEYLYGVSEVRKNLIETAEEMQNG